MVKKCPNCNEEVPDKANGCPKCGHEFSNSSQSPQQKTPSENGFSSTKIIAVIAIIVVIVIVGVLASGVLSQGSDVSVEKDNSNVQDTITNYDDNFSSDSSVYWASAKTDKFHLPECEWAQKISDANKIIYSSREDALADGKEPCEVCNP